MRRLAVVGAPAGLLMLAGCLASKSDIRLLQDELRMSREQVAAGDTSIMRAEQAHQGQIAQLSQQIARLNDSLRTLTSRLAAFQANSTGNFEAVNRQMIQMQTLLGQTTRNVQEAQAKLEALREQGLASAPAAPSAGSSPDTSRGPGPNTMFTTANEQLKQGRWTTARGGFEQLLAAYPNYEQASLAQFGIAETFKGQGNTAAADSVYQLVVTKFPRSDEASRAMYSHAKYLLDTNKRTEGRKVLQDLIKTYPNSDGARQATVLLRER